ncbi:MAG: hypothetical protein AB8G05_07910 [Oligoflexales bacterium]
MKADCCNIIVIFTLLVLLSSYSSIVEASSSPLRKKNIDRFNHQLEQTDPLAREDFSDFNKLSSFVFDDFEQSLKDRKINRMLSRFRKFFMSFNEGDESDFFDKNRLKKLNGKLIPLIGADTCAHRSAFLVNIAAIWGVDAIGQIAVDRKRLVGDSFIIEPGHVAAVFRVGGRGWIVDPTQGFLEDVNKWEVPVFGVKKSFRFPYGQATIWETDGLYEQCPELSRSEVNYFLRHETEHLDPLLYNEHIVRATSISMVIFKELIVRIVYESTLQRKQLSDDAIVDEHHNYRSWSQKFVDNGRPSEQLLKAVEAAYIKQLKSDLFLSFSGGWPNIGR